MSDGRIYLVGAGPGDPGLITLRGMELLSRADVVVYDYLVAPGLLAFAPADAEMIYVGKQAGKHAMPQEQINRLLVEKAQAGARVVRLKGGDPFVFGRGGEEALEAVEAGIEFEVVPGVTAGVAAPAYAGIPVTHRKLASNFGLVTGHEAPDKAESDLDFEALAAWRGTLTFYMGVGNLEPICRSLVAHGLDPATPAAVIRRGTTSRQEVVTATVEALPQAAAEAEIKPPAIIVVGQVVQLRERLQWFETRPLFGRRIVVTRAREQASRLTNRLSELGAEVIEMPAIRIAPPEDPDPLQKAIGGLAEFDWIVFTSANGVEMFFRYLTDAGLDARALANCKVCSIGPVTAERLIGFGVRPDAQPQKFLGAEIARTLEGLEELAGRKILCPRSDIAPRDLVDAMEAGGADVMEVAAYRTVPDCAGAERVEELLDGDEIDWITFTSSSTVRNFLGAIGPEKLTDRSVRLASIGPVTSGTLAEFGLSPHTEADAHTIDGLVDAILAAHVPGGSA